MEDTESSKPGEVHGADIIKRSVSALCNRSTFRGVFPSSCQVVKTKKGTKTNSSNYKPIIENSVPNYSKSLCLCFWTNKT